MAAAAYNPNTWEAKATRTPKTQYRYTLQNEF